MLNFPLFYVWQGWGWRVAIGVFVALLLLGAAKDGIISAASTSFEESIAQYETANARGRAMAIHSCEEMTRAIVEGADNFQTDAASANIRTGSKRSTYMENISYVPITVRVTFQTPNGSNGTSKAFGTCRFDWEFNRKNKHFASGMILRSYLLNGKKYLTGKNGGKKITAMGVASLTVQMQRVIRFHFGINPG